ncbi:hypothetical protein P7B02_02655 [Caulobacter segnis]|uniref:bile acid:sodium symporter family protein n=1 Tax=Caulobacter segnis TaxID=88688 RepID=UPI00240EE408|nr:hypothetical protein [Caulobacter segnis]MDG2520428.1 hypothetical protein [Caulobacter segnis]
MGGLVLANIAESVLLPASLAAIMFAIGLSLRPRAFLNLAIDRRPLAAGLVGIVFVVPLAGVAVAVALAPTPASAVGLVLLATCPVGILANVATDLCRGNTALSIALTVIVSGLYVFAAPLVAHYAVEIAFGESRRISAPTADLFWKVALVTVAPVSAGLVCARAAPDLARLSIPLKTAGSVLLVLVFAWVAARQRAVLADTMGLIVGLVLLVNLINAAIGLVIARAAALNDPDSAAVICSHMVRQEGTAIFIAVSVLGAPDIAVPLIINTFVGLAVCAALFAPLRLRRPPPGEVRP